MECTFQPRLLENSLILAEHQGIDFYERNGKWQVLKEIKKKQKKDIVERKEGYHCTFTPNLSKSQNKITQNTIKPFVANTEQFV